MGHNEELRERRAKAEEANQRALAALSERTLPIMEGHKSSLSSVGTNETSGTDLDLAAASNDLVNQAYYRPVARSSQLPTDNRASTEARRSPKVSNIIN